LSDPTLKPSDKLITIASKDIISIRTYHLADTIPTALQFSKYPLKFEGFLPFAAAPDLLWGVQGTTSLGQADSFASQEAGKLGGKKVFHIDLLYRLKAGSSTALSTTHESAIESGYLHFTRISKDYRTSLQKDMLEWLDAAHDRDIDALKAMDFEDMIICRPMLIHQLMTMQRHINIVIHSVNLNGGVALKIGVVRNTPAGVVRAETRYHEEIVTTV
jgi:hypothetical protein